MARAPGHLAVVDHAAAAVQDQIVAAQVFGKLVAGYEIERGSHAGVAAHHARQLDRADVVALAMVGACLRDEDMGRLCIRVGIVALLHAVEFVGAIDLGVESAAMACHEDAEAGQGHTLGYDLSHDAEGLRIGDGHARRCGKA